MRAHIEIVTDRLVLRSLALGDAGDIFGYGRDPEVTRYTSWPTHRSIDDAKQFVAFVLAQDSDRPNALRHTWAIRTRDGVKVIGTVDLVQDDPETAHTDFALAQPYWNHGYMTEAVRAVVTWGFDTLPDVRRVRSGCLAANDRSRRVLEKAGFNLVRRETLQFSEKFDFQRLEVCHYEKCRHDAPAPMLPNSRPEASRQD